MGCDIHAFVEWAFVKQEANAKEDGEPCRWRNVLKGGGRGFQLPRDYLMFGVLSGVRVPDMSMEVAPRGFPFDTASHETLDEFCIKVFDDDYPDDDVPGVEASGVYHESVEWEGIVARKSKISSHLSDQSFGKPYESAPYEFYPDPDWHSASWLYCDEYENVLQSYAMQSDFQPAEEYSAMLDYMKALEAGGKIRARVVFWYDN